MAQPIVMPSFGMYTAEGTLLRWLQPSGASVEAGEPVAEMETEKALADVSAPASGILHHVATPGTLLQVESLLGYVLAPGEAPPLADVPATTSFPAAETVAAQERVDTDARATPNAKRVAAELGVQVASVVGTGPGGRITEADVRAAAEEGRSSG